MPEIQAHKQAAVQFLELVVEGKIEEAYAKFVEMSGRHHNPFFPAGFPALRKAMRENHEQFPEKRLKVKHVLGDGEMVAVHSHIVHHPGQIGVAAVHIFRFSNDKIVEMWDCGQAIPEESPNRDGMF